MGPFSESGELLPSCISSGKLTSVDKLGKPKPKESSLSALIYARSSADPANIDPCEDCSVSLNIEQRTCKLLLSTNRTIFESIRRLSVESVVCHLCRAIRSASQFFLLSVSITHLMQSKEFHTSDPSDRRMRIHRDNSFIKCPCGLILPRSVYGIRNVLRI